MSMQVAAGAEGTLLVAQPTEDDFRQRHAVAWGHVRAFPARCTRAVGCSFVGCAPSTWLLLDLFLLSVGVCAGYALFDLPQAPVPHVALWQSLAIFNFAMTVANLILGLYERETIASRSRILTRILLTTAATAAITYALVYVVMYATVSRRVAGLALATHVIAGMGIRFWACWAMNAVKRSLLIVGPRSLYQSFKQAKSDGFLSEYKLVGYAGFNGESEVAADSDDWGQLVQQIHRVDRNAVTDIVVSKNAARDPSTRQWMLPCLQRGCRVTNEAIFYEKATGQILVDEITPEWFLFADLKVHCDEEATLKRVVDLVIAFLGLLLSAPLWPIIALAIKLCDGGPVFYSQTRIGQNGELFPLYKFRTMCINAENGRSVWAIPKDPRVTAVGRWLRQTRLDELPQLYNVLVGRMSIVGPRPERPDIVAELSDKIPYYAERHLVKPGLTGWAQISFRYGSSFEDAKRKLQFDLYYLKHMSFELDMIILFRTLGTFLRGAC